MNRTTFVLVLTGACVLLSCNPTDRQGENGNVTPPEMNKVGSSTSAQWDEPLNTKKDDNGGNSVTPSDSIRKKHHRN